MKKFTEIQLAFEINATVHQRLRIINDAYDEDSIIEGLNDGVLATTTWYDHDHAEYCDVFESVDVVLTGERVALILSQEIDGDYFDYR
jgi:hypothetical protein